MEFRITTNGAIFFVEWYNKDHYEEEKGSFWTLKWDNTVKVHKPEWQTVLYPDRYGLFSPAYFDTMEQARAFKAKAERRAKCINNPLKVVE